ncbi:uncharacterized protein [Nicotiana sylvestris]|uniref:uncharacterized protein n=1 Tax=Nicotiana sylvestris TaxID=4096 RepID=UPI00388C3DC2
MVDFDIILGMDWLSPHYAILDCRAKNMTLAMPGVPRVEWRGTLDHIPSRVISFFKAQRIVEKGCDRYLTYVRDVSIDTLSVDSVPVVRDFPDLFPADLLGLPPDRDIDFGIDLFPGTQPISIPLDCQYDDLHLLVLKDKVQHGDARDARDIPIGEDGHARLDLLVCLNMEFDISEYFPVAAMYLH